MINVKTTKRIPLIRQHDVLDCGPASLAMVCQAHGLKLPIATVREAVKTDQQGTSIYGMIDGAKKFGLTGEAFEGTPEDVWNAVKGPEFKGPAIIRILNWKGLEHYVVVKRIKRNKMEINDPDIGKRKMTEEEFKTCFLGQIIIYEVTNEFTAENRKKGSLSRFTRMILRQKSLLAWISVLSLGVTAIGISGTYVFQLLIDKFLPEMNDTGTSLHSFGILLICLMSLYALKFVIELLRGKLVVSMSRNIDIPLMLGIFEHTTKLPLAFFSSRKAGEILSRFQDSVSIRDAMSNATLTILIDIILCAGCAIVMFHTSSLLFCIAMITFAIYAIISMSYVQPINRLNYSIMEHGAQYNSFLKESVDAMEMVKNSQAEESIRNKTSELFRKYLKKSIKGSMLTLSRESLIELVTSISSLALLWFGSICILKGSMSIGSLITFSSLLGYFLTPVQNIIGLQGDIQTALVAADRLTDILAVNVEREDGIILNEKIHQVKFDHVNFRYGNRDLVLKEFNLEMNSGEHIALVGASGCGKTTAAKLLQGLYSPEESGTVLINNVPTENLSLSWIRSHIAVVPQINHFFSDTIRSQVTLGLEKTPKDSEILRVLDLCECLEFITSLDSVLEENGSNLSGGQKQRLAIARALIRRPDLLILDEATSALDAITESKVLEAIRNFDDHMIILMIAHRLSTVQKCDRILVVENGRVVESGNHKALLANPENTHYAKLWKTQNTLVA